MTPFHERGLAPLLRWAGGKRWLKPTVAVVARAWQPTAYVEPFVGGGAIFFAFNWPAPRLNDLNHELIATYRGVATDPEAVRLKLKSLRIDENTYERVRRWNPRRDEYRAARLLYLNRCGYGGIYRTNRQGVYNVPFSGDRTSRSLVSSGRIAAASVALRTASLSEGDFAAALGNVLPGTLVYCDPTYSLPGPEESFRRYATPVFSWKDQERLAAAAHDLARTGALVLVSNSADPRLASLYRGALVLTFKRRAPLPRAVGNLTLESLYILGPRRDVKSLDHALTKGVCDAGS